MSSAQGIELRLDCLSSNSREGGACVNKATNKFSPDIAGVFAENFAVYGVWNVWRQMNREGFAIARCTIERPMRDMGAACQ